MSGMLDIADQVSLKLNSTPNIGSVWIERAYIIDPTQLPAAVIHLDNIDEERHGFPVTNGRKWVTYDCLIELDTEVAADDTTSAARDWYGLLNALRAVIRADPSLNGYAHRWGESIRIRNSPLEAHDGIVHFHAEITTEILEEITG